MAHHQPARYVVCYDIADPKRLSRVHRCLKNEGLPLQYSVFNCCLTEKQLGLLMQNLKDLIDPREDDVRVYPLPQHTETLTLGQPMFPDGIMLMQSGGDLMQW